MNDKAVKFIRENVSSADHLVSSLMSSTTILTLPSTVSRRLEELSKSMESAIDHAKMESSADVGDCAKEDGAAAADDDGDASMTSPADADESKMPPKSRMSKIDRPNKRRRSLDHLCKKMKKAAKQHVAQPRTEYDEGMLVYPNPLLPDDHLDDCPEVLSALLFNIGQLQLKSHQEEVALRFFLLAGEVLASDDDSERSSSENHVRYQLAILHQIAYTHFRQQDYSSAMKALRKVLDVSEHQYGQHHLSTASALHCLGTVMFHLRDRENQEIMHTLQRALITRKLLLGSRHSDVATTLNNLGRVYFDCREIEKALSHYNEALQIRQDLFGEDHMDVSATTFNIGQAHHRLGHLDEALTHYSKFYSYISRCDTQDQHDEIVALKHMGQVYQEQKNIAEAKRCYQEAINLSLTVCDQQQEKESASILNMYGNMLYEAGTFDEAAEVYELGLAIERRVLEPCCVNVVVTLSNIGQALMQQGDYRRALCRYTEAYTTLSLQPEKDIKKMTETLSVIGQINNLLGNHAQAVKSFQEVVSMRKAALGDHVDVALALNYLGLLHFKRGSLDLAMNNFEESLRVRRSCNPNSTSGDIAVLSYNIGSIHLHRGDNERALKCYKDALEVERATYGHVHQDVAVTLQLIGKVYDKCGKYDEAIQYYTEALDIWKKCAESSVDTESQRKYKLNAAKLFVSIASIHLRQGRIDQMQQFLAEAHRIYRDVGVPPDDLKLSWFSLYELSLLHPHCAAAA